MLSDTYFPVPALNGLRCSKCFASSLWSYLLARLRSWEKAGSVRCQSAVCQFANNDRFVRSYNWFVQFFEFFWFLISSETLEHLRVSFIIIDRMRWQYTCCWLVHCFDSCLRFMFSPCFVSLFWNFIWEGCGSLHCGLENWIFEFQQTFGSKAWRV